MGKDTPFLCNKQALLHEYCVNKRIGEKNVFASDNYLAKIINKANKLF